jgi:hypothetical protein
MSPTETTDEQAVRALLAELADSTPVRPRRIIDLEAETRSLRSASEHRPSRRTWLLAAAAVVAVFALAVPLLMARDSADRFAVDAGDVPAVDTAALAGGRLAFVMENDLFLADGPTGEVRRITDTGTGEEVSHVSWSHDGEWVAFTIHDESGLWVVKRDGSERHRLGRSPSSYAWSPTANELVYATADEVRVAQVDGSSRALVGGPPPAPFTTVVWSPDGDQVAFAGPNGELAIATLRDRPDPGWRAGDSPPVSQVLAWPVDDLVLVTELDPDEVHVLGFHPSNGGVQGLATFTGPFDPTTGFAVSPDGRYFLLAPSLGQPVACVISGRIGDSTANCGLVNALPARVTMPAFSNVAPLVSPAISVVAGSELLIETEGPTDAAAVTSGGAIDDGTRGTIEVDGVGYGVVPEPPVWIGSEALIVRVNERDLVRIEVDTGERTTIVAGPRFLPPADDYPGGYGFAYWQPTP